MKLIIAVINHDDAQIVQQQLMQNGFFFTKLSTSGGFLRTGNTTILIGVEDDKVQNAIDLISKYSKSRKQMIPTTSDLGMGLYPAMPVEVIVGGATIFIINVEDFKKV